MTIPANIQKLLDQMEDELQRQPATIPDDIENRLMVFESQAPLAGVPGQIARDQVSTLGGRASVPFIQFDAGVTNRGVAAQNSLLQVLREFQPSAGPMIASQLEENREEYFANEALMEALSDEAPFGSFAGDALQFVSEVILTGKQFKHGNKKIQLAGRTVQEGAIGALFGATTVGMTDEQKSMLIAGGLLTGAISPSLFSGVGRLVRMEPSRVERIADLARMEKSFHRTGLLTAGELTSIRGLKKIEAAIDNIPILGLGAKRGRQRDAFNEMTDSLFNRITGGSNIKRGKPFTPGRVTARTPDELRALKEGLTDAVRARFKRHSDIVDREYKDLAKYIDDVVAAAPRGRTGRAPEVVLLSTRRAARELLEDELSLSKAVQNKALIRKLQDFIDDERLTFSGAQRSLSRIKEQVRVANAQADRAEITRETAGALTQIQLGMIDDMQRFSDMYSIDGSIAQRLNAANNKFKDLILPFYGAADIRAMARGDFDVRMDVDSIVGAFLNNTMPGRSKATMEFLGPRDQDIARYLILREAFDAANGGRADLFMQPNAFANKLEQMQALWKESFTPEQQQILEGYITLVEQGKRAFKPEDAIGPLVAGGAAGMIGANKVGADTSGRVVKWLSALTGARIFLGTRAGTDILKLAAKAQTSAEFAKVDAMAEQYMIRWLEQNYSKLFNAVNPGLQGPYRDYNPYTDPYMQSNPPREDLIRRE